MNRNRTNLQNAKNSNHRAITALGIIFLLIFAGCFTLYLLFESDRKIIEDELVSRTVNAAAYFDLSVNNILSSADSTLRSIRRVYEYNGTTSEVSEFLDAAPINEEIISHVTIINENGQPIFNSKYKIQPSVNTIDRPYFNFFKDLDRGDQLFISLPHRGRNSDKYIIRLVRPLHRVNGEFSGVIFVAIDPDIFTQFFNLVDWRDGGTATLVGLDRRIRARSSYKSVAIGQDISGSQLWREVSQNPTGVYEQTSVVDNVKRIYAYRKMAAYDLITAVGISQAHILQELDKRRTNFLLIAGFMTCTLIALSIIIYREFSINEKVRRINEVKSEFLAHMSHELRTPLNSIIGFSEAMTLETFGKIENNKYKSYARHIHTAGCHQLNLVNELLDLSAIEAGQRNPQWTVVDPRHLIDAALELVGNIKETKKINCVIDIHSEVNSLKADWQMSLQVMVNLLSNAFKFSNAQSSVYLTCTPNMDGGTLITLRDEGCGIPASDLPDILKPFHQVRRSVRVAAEGSGLGLSLSKELMRVQGGDLTISSVEAVGTTAHLTFLSQTA